MYHSITIEGMAVRCPAYPFRIPITIPFMVPNTTHGVESTFVRVKERTFPIHTPQLTNGSDADHDREMMLADRIKELNDRSIPAEFGIHKDTLAIPLSPLVLATILAGLMLMITFIVCWKCACQRQSNPTRTSAPTNVTVVNQVPNQRPLPLGPPESIYERINEFQNYPAYGLGRFYPRIANLSLNANLSRTFTI